MTGGEPGVVIVGAGECGARAAMALREEGYTGSVTLVGGEPHPPYERPPLSKAAMGEDGAVNAAPSTKTIVSAERLADAGVRYLAGVVATSIEREERVVRLDTGEALSYAKLLLATGARPRRLALADGVRHALVLRTLDDARAVRARLNPGARLLVVGGGFIGLELAASARGLGAEVTVLEAGPRVLGRAVPEAIAAVVHARHEREGVRVLTGQSITALADTPDGVRVTLASGDAVEADLAVIGIGAEPNTDLAEAASLMVENGVAVDAFLRTSDPDIFAAGDCCSFPNPRDGGRRVRLEAWRNAQEQGALAASNMLGGAQAHAAVPWFWSDQYDLGLQIAGLAGAAPTVVRRTLSEDAFLLFHLDDTGRLVAASGIGPGNAIARDIRLAEMLIARGARPAPDRLAAPDAKLKAMLAA